MLTKTIKVYAKLNLNLYIKGVSEGYHVLDSFMTSVDVFDKLTVNERLDNAIYISGTPFVENNKNTAYKAAQLFAQQYNTCGCDILIQKGIPLSGGMGGSSADAAGVLVALADMYGVDKDSCDFKAICAKCGSDVVFMAKGGLARLTDRGTQLQYFDYSQPMYFVITTFDVNINTAEVFGLWDGMATECKYNDNVLTDIIARDAKINGAFLHNDLQSAVTKHFDYADKYLNVCKQLGIATTMTGSGSAFFVLTDNFVSATDICNQLTALGFNSKVAVRKLCGTECV